MQRSVILSACRTPIGRFEGALASIPAPRLGAIVTRAAVEQAGIEPPTVDEVILGNVLSTGVGQAPARQAALGSGLPSSVAALTISKVCGSGLKAVMLADQAIRCKDANIVVAGGMESMSRAGWYLSRGHDGIGDRTLKDVMMHDGLSCAYANCSMGQIAERLAQRLGITREQQDRYALESHRRATSAMESGVFDHDLAPVPVKRRHEQTEVIVDEGPRADTSLEKLAKLPAVFADDGTVTAGNSSMISDGAAAVVVTSETYASRLGRPPLARILASATSGTDPEDLFIAPVAAIRQVLATANRNLSDVDLFEINEAFAVQMLACIGQLELPPDRVNVHGGAIALGHPIGASGARVLVTLLSAMQHRNVSTGIAALCLGGGNAVAMLIERDLT